MANPEWGKKYICHGCGKPFYDMKKSEVICPACGVSYQHELSLKSVYAKRPVVAAKATKSGAVAMVADTELVAAVATAAVIGETALPEEAVDEAEADEMDGLFDE